MKRKILHALLAVVISFGLWLYVIATENPDHEETFYNVKVVLTGESFLHERGMMLMDNTIPTVTLKMKGNRSDLNKIKSDNITLVADLSKISETGEQRLFYSINLPGDVPDNAVSIEDRQPSSITVNVVGRSEKYVNVVPHFKGSVKEGFMADKKNYELDYGQIKVIGPTSVIEQIDHACFEVNLDQKTETISESFSYTLCDKNDQPVDVSKVETKVNKINLTVKIQRLKTVPLKLDVIYGGGATVTNTQIIIDPLEIQISGSEQILETLDSVVVGKINLAEVLNDDVLEFEIELPEGVNNVTGTTKVEVSIKFLRLVTKTLDVSNFQVYNVPVGMRADIMTKELSVTLRGPAAQILALSAENVVARVDFSGAEVGNATFDATIYIYGNAYADVGSIGTYSVYANLAEIVRVEE